MIKLDYEWDKDTNRLAFILENENEVISYYIGKKNTPEDILRALKKDLERNSRMKYPLIISNKKSVFIFPSRWTLCPLVFSKKELREAIRRDVS